MNIISVHPWSRTNDKFIRTNRINGTPITHNIGHELITAKTHTSPCAFYSKIALDIVNETVFNYPHRYISEKTIRPILQKRMFIILGPARMLEQLHSMGFVTFDDILNESYDQITDPEERFLAVIKSIQDFCQLDIDQIKEYYRTNSWKFDYNFDNLKKLHQQELEKIQQL